MGEEANMEAVLSLRDEDRDNHLSYLITDGGNAVGRGYTPKRANTTWLLRFCIYSGLTRQQVRALRVFWDGRDVTEDFAADFAGPQEPQPMFRRLERQGCRAPMPLHLLRERFSMPEASDAIRTTGKYLRFWKVQLGREEDREQTRDCVALLQTVAVHPHGRAADELDLMRRICLEVEHSSQAHPTHDIGLDILQTMTSLIQDLSASLHTKESALHVWLLRMYVSPGLWRQLHRQAPLSIRGLPFAHIQQLADIRYFPFKAPGGTWLRLRPGDWVRAEELLAGWNPVVIEVHFYAPHTEEEEESVLVEYSANNLDGAEVRGRLNKREPWLGPLKGVRDAFALVGVTWDFVRFTVDCNDGNYEGSFLSAHQAMTPVVDVLRALFPRVAW